MLFSAQTLTQALQDFSENLGAMLSLGETVAPKKASMLLCVNDMLVFIICGSQTLGLVSGPKPIGETKVLIAEL